MHIYRHIYRHISYVIFLGFLCSACLSTIDPLAEISTQPVTVKMDFLHRPLPEIPLPNDLATRYDPQSPTLRRLNASMIAKTYNESRVRTLIDQLDGWGVNQPITIPFTGAIDPLSILKGHRDQDYRTENDVIFLIDVTPSSSEYGQIQHVDLGEGNYPLVLEDLNGYWEHDPRGWTLSLTLEEANEDLDENGEIGLGEDLNGNGILDQGEDLNGNNILDPPEDLDADGVLDRPNYLPCQSVQALKVPCDQNKVWALPQRDQLKNRADALMSFYERQTNTLIMRAMRTLRERTTYAVVLTKRILDEDGNPIGSPFQGIHHLSQSEALKNVDQFLPEGLSKDDIAFAFSFTTQSLGSNWVAVREGLYGQGIQAHLAEQFPAQLKQVAPLRDRTNTKFMEIDNPYIMYTQDWIIPFRALAASPILGQNANSRSFQSQIQAQSTVDYHVIASFKSPQLYSRTPRKGVDTPRSVDCSALCQNIKSCDASLLEAWSLNDSCESTCETWYPATNFCLYKHQELHHAEVTVSSCEILLSCVQPRLDELLDVEIDPSMEVIDETRQQVAALGSDESWQGDQDQFIRGCSAPEICVADEIDVAEWQELNDQSWPHNLTEVPVEAKSEEVWFWFMKPSDDVLRKGEPTPLAIISHGYASNRFESLIFAGYFARRGIATIAIDCPSHGLELTESDRETASILTDIHGITPFLEAAAQGRARNQDFKDSVDSGADFWTSYVFHTRDVVRQCVLDHMQLVRLIKSFDGKRRWAFDLNGDGENELAGDFDADGILDISKDSPLYVTGASLGGIVGSLLGSLEPALDVSVPISGGGGLGDIGVRSLQGGVREAVILRVMGPLFIGVAEGEQTRVYTLVPELNNDGRRNLGILKKLSQYDTIVVENLSNGEKGCGYVQENGSFRVGVESDRGDLIKIHTYAGPQLAGDEWCTLRNPTIKPLETLDQFGENLRFLGRTYPIGAPLVTLAEGFGEKRNSPGLRRFLGLGQLVLDGGDPASYARHALDEPLHYPLLDEKTGAHTLIVTTMGDMNVPASSGLTLGRAAGLIDYLNPKTIYKNRTANQVLLDHYVAEAVHTLGRYQDENQAPVHIDVEGFSKGEDIWSLRGVPRIDQPVRSGLDHRDRLGGFSGALFPYALPEGQHGFNFPGMDQDLYIQHCETECDQQWLADGLKVEDLSEEDQAEYQVCMNPCPTAYEGRFDVGYFLLNVISSYMKSGGKTWNIDECHATDSCFD
jgi:hypothetical protein